MESKLTYISLFSNAGIGCYGFKQEGFECVATNEILKERLKIQQYNNKCKYSSGYICDDITLKSTKEKILREIQLWRDNEEIIDVDVIIATPPCQGMSVANLKKKNELARNSLAVESIKLVKEIRPKVFVFENVRSFLTTPCTDIDGKLRPIKSAIEHNLSEYHILYSIIDFKFYGNSSQRTRTIVIGTRKDLSDITPYDFFPDREKKITLREAIGHLPSLRQLGEVYPNDIFHNFRVYPEHMREWIRSLKEGQSAFDNKDIRKKPHQIINGKIVVNKQKNGDKYRRCFWNKPGFCVHTRNDQLASQMTIHPSDDRVFSIRELMILMSIPSKFKWSDKDFSELNALSYEDKRKFLKKEELNIRRTIGESVSTVIFRKIASKIKTGLSREVLKDSSVMNLIVQNNLEDFKHLYNFIKANLNNYTYQELSKIAELANSRRLHNAAYYTSQDICYSMIKDLPEFTSQDAIRILEPSVGLGNFIPLLIRKYENVKHVDIDVIDIDDNSLSLLKLLLEKIVIPNNFKINFINKDFLSKNVCFAENLLDAQRSIKDKYDIVIGNPPFKKVGNNKELLSAYKANAYNKKTNNIFSFFIEKSLRTGKFVSLIVPKTLLSTPEFNRTRELMSNFRIIKLCDYGELAFKIKIETISFIVDSRHSVASNKTNMTKIESYITKDVHYSPQQYICDVSYPYWLIYKDSFFDTISKKLEFDIFTVFRDRQITNGLLSKRGKYRVLKSRNIGNGRIVNRKGYDRYINNINGIPVGKFMNRSRAILIPNLTYLPRACFLPRSTIADGSVAIATTKNGNSVTRRDLAYYSTDEFRKFYSIARNISSRTMNIDSNSIFFFGKLKNCRRNRGHNEISNSSTPRNF